MTQYHTAQLADRSLDAADYAMHKSHLLPHVPQHFPTDVLDEDLCAYRHRTHFVILRGYVSSSTHIRTPRPGETLSSRLQTTSAGSDSLALSVPQSVVGLAIDLYILILPIIALAQLQLPRRRKVGISLIFMTGIVLEVLIMCQSGHPADDLQGLLVLIAQHLLQTTTKS
jgi:hypothetical protein